MAPKPGKTTAQNHQNQLERLILHTLGSRDLLPWGLPADRIQRANGSKSPGSESRGSAHLQEALRAIEEPGCKTQSFQIPNTFDGSGNHTFTGVSNQKTYISGTWILWRRGAASYDGVGVLRYCAGSFSLGFLGQNIKKRLACGGVLA